MRPLTGRVNCGIVVIGLILTTAAGASSQIESGSDLLIDIARLHDRGWEERKKISIEESERTFREAQRRLKTYRNKYIKDKSSISFLRATFRLGYLSELAGRNKDAQDFYLQCLKHPAIHSDAAKADGIPIYQQASARLIIVEQRMRPPSKSTSDDYPRISVKGGSKGSKSEDPPNRSFDLNP